MRSREEIEVNMELSQYLADTVIDEFERGMYAGGAAMLRWVLSDGTDHAALADWSMGNG